MTASVADAAVNISTVVAAAVATLLLLGAAVSVVVKMGAMQTAPTASSRALEGNGPPPDSRRNLKHWACFWSSLRQ